jgi:subtilisin family serine protease
MQQRLKLSGLLHISVVTSLLGSAFFPSTALAVKPGWIKPADKAEKTSTKEKSEKKKKSEKKPTPEELAEIEPAVGPAIIGLPAIAGVGGAAAVAGVAAAAGGGGGSSSSDDGGNGGGGSEPEPDPEPSPSPDPEPQPSEADAQAGLATINAITAHSRGLDGSGTTIGFVDSGIDTDHSEFAGRIQGCYDAAGAQEGCDNISVMYHGTHVAGIAAAARDDNGMMGVAYNAGILNADIFAGEGFGVGWDQQAQAINWTVSKGANVINNSYGVSTHDSYEIEAINATFDPATTDIGAAYNNAVNNDVVMIWAAGNEGASQPGLMSALPLYFPQWEELWVAVTAVTTNGSSLASYASKCGDASEFCISAPGGDSLNGGGIYSTYPGGLYATASGSSMAVPHVSGAVALLLEKFGPGTPTNKTPEEVVDLMFATADKSGIYSDSNTFGQGLLDIDEATQPDAATLAFSTGAQSLSTGTQPVENTSVNFGAAFGDAADLALSGKLAGAGDKYGRIFMVDLGGLSQGEEPYSDSFRLIGNFVHKKTHNVTLSPGSQMSFAFKSGKQKKNPQIEKLSFSSQVNDRATMKVGYGLNPGERLGLQSEKALDSSLLKANEQSVNPWLDFAGDQAFSAGMELSPSFAGGNVKLRPVTFFAQKSENDPLYGEAFSDQRDSVSGFALESEFSAGERLSVSLLSGTINESEQILGMKGEGGFSTEENTMTFFAGPSARFRINDKISLIGSYQYGWTDAKEVHGSLFSNFSTINSGSFTLGFTGARIFPGKDSWGLMVHQPLRVNSSEATLTLLEGRSDYGEPIYNRERISLEPSGRELNFQSFYSREIDERRDFSAGLMLRLEPGHNADADAEGVGLIRYSVRF